MELYELTEQQKYKLKSALGTGDLEVLQQISLIPRILIREIKPMILDTIKKSVEGESSEVDVWRKKRSESAVREYNGILIERQKIDFLIDKIYVMSRLCKYNRNEDIRLFLETLTLQGFFKNIDSKSQKDVIEYLLLVYIKCGSNSCAELIMKLKDAKLTYTDNPMVRKVGNVLDIAKGKTTFEYIDTLDESILLDFMSISIVILKSLPHDNIRILLWQELTYILMTPIDRKADLEELKILAKDYFRFLLEDTSARKVNKRSIIDEIHSNLASIDKTNLKSGEQNKK